MDADHVLRFVRYWESLAPKLEAQGRDVKFVVVVSSAFQGQEGARHPYWARAEEIGEKTGLQLAYVTASDLAWAAAQLEIADLPLDARCRFDWSRLLSHGLVNASDFDQALAEVLP
jgi:hypothetical protein